MAMNEDNDDGLGGRSRDRRETTEANRWSRPLRALEPLQIVAAPMPEELRDVVRAAKAITSGRASNREDQRIDKMVRALEEDEIEALDAFLGAPPTVESLLEAWADRLVGEGDPAIDAWMARWPGGDRQRLRTLARNARGGDPARARSLEAALRDDCAR